MQLQARDKRALIGGAVVVTGLLAILLWPRGSAEGEVQLVPAAERGAPPPTTINPAPQPVAAAPVAPSVPTNAAQAAAPAGGAAPGGIPDGLKLTGVTATGAIFSYPNGSQMLVTRGREVAPGVTLQTVRMRDVLLSANGTILRLSFSGPAVPVQAPTGGVAAPVAAPSTTPVQAGPTPPRPTPPPPPGPDRSLFR